MVIRIRALFSTGKVRMVIVRECVVERIQGMVNFYIHDFSAAPAIYCLLYEAGSLLSFSNSGCRTDSDPSRIYLLVLCYYFFYSFMIFRPRLQYIACCMKLDHCFHFQIPLQNRFRSEPNLPPGALLLFFLFFHDFSAAPAIYCLLYEAGSLLSFSNSAAEPIQIRAESSFWCFAVIFSILS
jgi:hypothetical protein